jgi:hypothetical protein
MPAVRIRLVTGCPGQTNDARRPTRSTVPLVLVPIARRVPRPARASGDRRSSKRPDQHHRRDEAQHAGRADAAATRFRRARASRRPDARSRLPLRAMIAAAASVGARSPWRSR